MNEPLVKVHHAEKALHLLLCGQGWKIADFINMCFKWTNSIFQNLVTEKINGGSAETAFQWIEHHTEH